MPGLPANVFTLLWNSVLAASCAESARNAGSKVKLPLSASLSKYKYPACGLSQLILNFHPRSKGSLPSEAYSLPSGAPPCIRCTVNQTRKLRSGATGAVVTVDKEGTTGGGTTGGGTTGGSNNGTTSKIIVGGNFSYTWSRLYDNQFGESNFYSASPGIQNNYEVVEGSPYYNPDANYSRSLLDSPHKLVLAPTFNLPFGEGRKWMNNSPTADLLLGGWSLTAVVNVQSGFPIGVRQNITTPQTWLMGGCGTTTACAGNPRPNVVPGQDFALPGDITDRIRANVNDNVYLNPAAFSLAAANSFGNAPRILPGVYSPWRNSTNLSVSKNIRTGAGTNVSVRLEVLNMLNQVQWAAPASNQFGNSAFAQITNQATNMRMYQFTFRFQF